MPDSQSREPGFKSPLLPFRSLVIFVIFTKSVKHFERSNGLDTALYKTIPLPFPHLFSMGEQPWSAVCRKVCGTNCPPYLGQGTDNLCVIKICRSRSKRRSSFRQTRGSKVSLKITIILIVGAMNNILHTL